MRNRRGPNVELAVRWEAVQTEYMPTALILNYVEREINEVLGGLRPAGANEDPYGLHSLPGPI